MSDTFLRPTVGLIGDNSSLTFEAGNGVLYPAVTVRTADKRDREFLERHPEVAAVPHGFYYAHQPETGAAIFLGRCLAAKVVAVRPFVIVSGDVPAGKLDFSFLSYDTKHPVFSETVRGLAVKAASKPPASIRPAGLDGFATGKFGRFTNPAGRDCGIYLELLLEAAGMTVAMRFSGDMAMSHQIMANLSPGDFMEFEARSFKNNAHYSELMKVNTLWWDDWMRTLARAGKLIKESEYVFPA